MCFGFPQSLAVCESDQLIKKTLQRHEPTYYQTNLLSDKI